jgi:hypothetical protein
MKTIYAFIVCVFVFTPPVDAQVCTPPEPLDQQAAVGTWQGHYTENGAVKNLRIEIKEVSGQLVSYIDIPDRRLKNSKFETSICSSMELHMKNTGVDNITLQFVGKPKGDRMSGRFRIGDTCGSASNDTFSLIKTGNALSFK